ncbi:hypothetical protein N8I77_013473 [Diaporthe amygdali]|uniref:Uncharacterized protein n=1 Tax=Phomopsis amygdali TaxID=1214568 RepID=A0AAD9S1G5_PHOAM|nr:hypothetical protein N8I77_013473 [Diaporthe amygdali]
MADSNTWSTQAQDGFKESHHTPGGDGCGHGQQIPSVNQQGEESAGARTSSYHHDSLACAIQNEDAERRAKRRAEELAASLRPFKKQRPSGRSSDSHRDTTGTGS